MKYLILWILITLSTSIFADHKVIWSCTAFSGNKLGIKNVSILERISQDYDQPEWIMQIQYADLSITAGTDAEYLDDFDFNGYGSEYLGLNLKLQGAQATKYEYLIQDETGIKIKLKCVFKT